MERTIACVPPNRYTLDEVTHLTQMVEGLLTLAPADCGHADLNNSAFSATGFVEEVVELLQLLAAERHQRVTIQG